MIRLPHIWTAATLAAVAGACGGDRSQEDVALRDTSGAPMTDTAAAADTMPNATTPETTATRPETTTTSRPQPSGNRNPSGAPTPRPKPDTPAVRPNVDPARIPAQTPKPVRVPKPADQPPPRERATRDTATRDAATGDTATGDTATGDTAARDTPTPPPATQPLRDEYHRPPKDTVSQAVYDGWKQYNLNCARCHGEDVLGSTIAPHLIASVKPNGPINTKELFMQTVCQGRPEKGMPAWCPLGLEMEKIDQIYQYVKGRSDAKIGPGRPAVRADG